MIDMRKVCNIRNRRAAGETVAQIARREGVSEPTVRKYLRMDDFSPRPPRASPRPSVLDPFKPAIEEMLEQDRRAWHKQRHTAKRVYERLRDEHGYAGGYSTVQAYVRRRRAELGCPRGQYLDLEWEPGEAQVDFGQADMRERGVLTRKHFLATCFPYSNVGPAQVFHGETAECVCQGLKDVFELVGGVPRRLVFDNATGVGRKVCGKVSTSELFGRFAAHYGFEFSFCNPDSGHEKGAVENKVGATRRDLFVPVPSFDSIRGYNERLLGRCMERSRKEHYAKGVPELELFERDKEALLPLPARPFDVVSYADGPYTADRYGKVCVDGCHRYSVDPSRAGERLVVGKAAFEVRVYSLGGEPLAVHERRFGSAPTDSTDPASQLSLLCVKQNGWRNSKVRARMPDELREAMDAMDKARRGEALRALRDAAAESGYGNAVEAARSSVAMLGRVDGPALAVMSRALADGRGAPSYEHDAGLGEYDRAFSPSGGGHRG